MSADEGLTARNEPAEFEKVLPASANQVATFDEERPGALRRAQHFLHAFPTTIPFLVLLIGIIFFSSIVGPKFFAPFNLSLILQQVTIIAILGMAQTLVILTAGIDLSVGVIMILSSVVMGRTAVVYGVPIEIAFPLGLACGLACGFVNGAIITFLQLPPFIVTLGTWSIFGALNIFYSRSETIRQQDIEAAAPFLQWTGTVIKPYDLMLNTFGLAVPWLKGSVITYGSILMIVLAAAVWYLLNRTAFGRHVYATGDDPDAARLAGINTRRTLISVYALAGLICAIAAWVLIGRIGGVSPQAGQTANLDSITAVVIGGTSLFGGRGSIIGTLVGALIVGVFRNGLSLAGLDVLWQEFTVGVLIIVAVTLDQWIRRVSS
jgi:fructose transport system permease protein